MVVGEVAIALMLLVASGLSIRGTLRLAKGDHGFDPEGLMTFDITLPERSYDTEEKRRQFFRTVVEGIREAPGRHRPIWPSCSLRAERTTRTTSTWRSGGSRTWPTAPWLTSA